MNNEQLTPKLQTVRAILQEFERVIVAFSGGVDSTVLTKVACEVLGRHRVLAVTADSPSLARHELKEARRLAAWLDVPHLVITTHETQDPTYQANSPLRCYVCKQALFEELEELARARQISVILYGAIGDDRSDDRPGQQAALQRGVRAPLQEAGIEKWEVRQLARQLGLPNWDKPQNACLASRIPHGASVTEDKLKQVEAAEAFLKSRGFRQVRVRHLGTHARIEVESQAAGRFEEAALRREMAVVFAQLGFASVGIDQCGYRPGGADTTPMNEKRLF